MYSHFLDLLNQISPLSEESRTALLPFLSVKSVAKGDFILKQGEVCRHIYYIESGFARIFYFKDGKNITEWFADEKNFCFSITSYFEQIPSNLVIEALEDCEVILLSRQGLEELRTGNLEVANLIIEFFSGSLKLSQKRMESLQFESASSRYQNLLEEQPEILNKVSLQHIATFLGITQETLSRIRSKI